VIAGLKDDNTPFLSGMDLIGAPVFAHDFVVSGTCTPNLHGMCEALYRPDMVRSLFRNKLIVLHFSKFFCDRTPTNSSRCFPSACSLQSTEMPLAAGEVSSKSCKFWSLSVLLTDHYLIFISLLAAVLLKASSWKIWDVAKIKISCGIFAML